MYLSRLAILACFLLIAGCIGGSQGGVVYEKTGAVEEGYDEDWDMEYDDSPEGLARYFDQELSDADYENLGIDMDDPIDIDDVQMGDLDDICSEESDVDGCLAEQALKYGDYSLCEMMGDKTARDLCYFEIARDLADTSICDMIEAEPESKACALSIPA